MITIVLGTAHQKSILGKGSPDGRIKEYQYSRELCQAIKSILENLGFRVIIDVEEDDLKMTQSKELITRCQVVNSLVKQYKDCIYISIHLNAAGSDGKWHNATGWEIYTSVGQTKSDILAEYIYKAARYNNKEKKLRVDNSDGDSDKEAHLYVLKHTDCPAVLTENFFMDSKNDVEYLLSDEGFHNIVRTHVEGILNYIKDNQ